jgi:hypothetical protein
VTASGPVAFFSAKPIASRLNQKKIRDDQNHRAIHDAHVRAIGFPNLSIAHLGPDLAF